MWYNYSKRTGEILRKILDFVIFLKTKLKAKIIKFLGTPRRLKLSFASFLLLVLGTGVSFIPVARAQTTYRVENLDIVIGTDPSGNGVKGEYRIVANETLKIKYYLNWGPKSQNAYPTLKSEIITDRTTDTLEGFYVGFNYADYDVPRCYSTIGSNNCVLNAKSKVSDSLPVLESLEVPYSTLIKDGNFPLKSASSTPVGEALGSKGFAVFPVLKMDSTLGSNDYGLSKNPAKLIVRVYANEASRKASFDKDGLQYTTGQQEAGQGVNVTARGRSSTGASAFTAFLNDLFTGIAQFFITLTYTLFTKVISPLLEGLLSIRVYTDQFVNVIYPGWEVLRNVVNIYFIIAIIAIALGTLFRLESYQAKHLLVQLIIAALTVNFSLVIGQAILGVADTVQSQFLPNSSEVIKRLGRDLMPANIQDIVNANPLVEGSFFASAITTLFLMSMAVGSFLVFCAIAIFLIIRIIMLWILLMVSPLAYAARVLPSTQSLSGQWWGEFLKYAFFTPVMAFFLNLTAIIAVKYEYVFRDINSRVVAGDPQLKDLSTLIFAVASNILLLVFLVAAIQVADKFGIYGANVITTTVKTGMFAPFVGAGGAAAYVGKGLGETVGRKVATKYNQWTFPLADKGVLGRAAYGILHIPSTLKAGKKDSERDLEASEHLKEAASLKVRRSIPIFGRKGKDPTYHAAIDEGEKRLNEVYGHYTGNETEEVKRALELYEDALKGDGNAKMMFGAQWLRMIKNKNDNQFLYDWGKKYLGKDVELAYNDVNLIGLINKFQKEDGLFSHSFAEELLTTMSEVGYEGKNYALTELSDGHKILKTKMRADKKGFEVEGQEEWNKLDEYVNGTAPANDKEYKERKADILANRGPHAATFRANFKASTGRDFSEDGYKNVAFIQEQRFKRNVNVSKLENKFAMFHNSMFTTDDEGRVVLGNGGDAAMTTLTDSDFWRMGRGGLTNKQQEWLEKMFKAEKNEDGSPKYSVQDKIDFQIKTIKKQIFDEAARKGVKMDDAKAEAGARNLTRMLALSLYSARKNSNLDNVRQELATKGGRGGSLTKEELFEGPKAITDSELSNFIERAELKNFV